MRHIGDITKISGYRVPPVDAVIGGSPCQDLSTAGKRAGLAGQRSGLFMEQIRIIKEMRIADASIGRTGHIVRPRFMVWENVPGAFSSNHGEDFRAVLEETAKIADENAVIPEPPKRKWSTAGAIMGNGWSIAWRVLDAQFWGVPQRRRRIALVADFGGASAPEILFERKSVCGNTAQGGTQGEGTSSEAENSTGTTNLYCLQGNVINGGSKQLGNGWRKEPMYTLTATDIHGIVHPAVSMQSFGEYKLSKVASPCKARDCKDATDLVIGTEGVRNVVRRLTPLEYERLQGYPDGWTDIGEWVDSKGKKRKLSDSARYKALGNSIALPPWRYVLSRLCKQIGRPATMASLFDGIGGFPLIWEEINGAGSCLWASEIEEFPIAVTKRRFCDESIAAPRE